MNKKSLLLLILLSLPSFAGMRYTEDRTSGAAYGDGMPICDDGTIPDKDGNYYLPGTEIVCKLSQNDLEKAHRNK
ncbi:hypothetical protein RHO13_09710 [Orbus wheelerorum]|uniref:hypothetical protein n=1 Tax=Orbus wheelerorum TaxID=3074111 RepID=UPI00370D97B9